MQIENNVNYFYSNGKLLLSGEYLVMNGAKAIALPLNLGQSLIIDEQKTNQISWETYELEKLVFTAGFSLHNFDILETTNYEKASYIQKLIKAVKLLSPDFLNHSKGILAKAKVQFNMNYGLGTSSTLINNIAQWSQVDAFELNQSISKGSGFDIACANATQPFIYTLLDQKPLSEPIVFNPPFLPQLFLIYLNKKMATEENIKNINPNQKNANQLIPKINEISSKIMDCKQFNVFQDLITRHEEIIGSYLQKKPVKEEIFNDFQGAIKSLGAWGGDFILTASPLSFETQKQYFKQKGYATMLRLVELMINSPMIEVRS